MPYLFPGTVSIKCVGMPFNGSHVCPGSIHRSACLCSDRAWWQWRPWPQARPLAYGGADGLLVVMSTLSHCGDRFECGGRRGQRGCQWGCGGFSSPTLTTTPLPHVGFWQRLGNVKPAWEISTLFYTKTTWWFLYQCICLTITVLSRRGNPSCCTCYLLFAYLFSFKKL